MNGRPPKGEHGGSRCQRIALTNAPLVARAAEESIDLDWEPLGSVSPRDLVAAREQAHWAAQVVAAVGETHVPHAIDTSHTAMGYRLELGALAGAAIPAGVGELRAALRLSELRLLVTVGDEVTDSAALEGKTLAEATAWMADTLASRSKGERGGPLVSPDYDLEPHGIARGEAFTAEPAALGELDRWLANAQRALADCVSTQRDGPILCWPHHFDLAALRVVESDAAGPASKTVGVGFSPGDVAIPEPYWYVNHWPASDPMETSFPPLAVGRWHSEGFVAAILTGTEIVAEGDGVRQASAVKTFVERATQHSEELLR